LRKRRCNIIAPNVILPFDGNHADIPSGYTRETTFDSRIPRHSNTGTGATGGATTHTHSTSAAHQHTLNNHTHSVSFGYYSEALNTGGSSTSIKGYHNHTTTTSGNPTATTYSSNDSFTTGSGDSLPPYYKVIYIKSTGYSVIPNNAIVYAQSAKNGLTLCNGSSGTPNLTSKFLMGASTGANAGSTGGSSTHTHTINHTHVSGASHQHSGTSGDYNGPNVTHGGADGSTGVYDHTHTYTTGATTASISSYSGSSGNNSATSLPPYTSLLPLKNVSGSGLMPPVGIIALYKETTIPVGWNLCDGNNDTPNLATNKYVMCSTSVTTGGATTHTHGSVSHTHTSSSHTHSGTTNNTTASTYQISSTTANGRARATHNHSLSAAGTTATYSNANYPFSSANNDPSYIEVKFIQFEFPPVIPNPIIGMLIDKL